MKYLLLSLMFLLPFTTAAQAQLDKKPATKTGIAGHTVWIEPRTGMEFIWLKGGCFLMGSPENENGRNLDEEQHEVCVDGFWMGKYEVTNRQFRLFYPTHVVNKYKELSLDGDDQPVANVSWDRARKFADWLGDHKNSPFDLPTEAQWEYAARSGATTARFWGGSPDQACGYANVHDQTSKDKFDWSWLTHDCSDGYAVAAPKGSFKANAFGLHDMLGNVWEWCLDKYGKYGAAQDKSSRNYLYVIRGGSWLSTPAYVRSAIRGGAQLRDDRIGFRLVKIKK
jgi:formylglycine-generating enzyme required for sulfatase activity